MQKDARELRDFINRRVLAHYPLVTCNFEETGGHHVKITLGAPNGRQTTLYCTAGGDPTTRNNVERDVKQGLRKLNIALQGEDRIMASIKSHHPNGNGKPHVVRSFKDIGKATDLAAEIDTTPQSDVKRQRYNATPPEVIAKAQRLRNEGLTIPRVCALTGLSPASIYKLTRPKAAGDAGHKTEEAVVEKRPVTRLTHDIVVKIGMQLSVRCEDRDGTAVYAEGWDDAKIAATVGCPEAAVREFRIKEIGRLDSETVRNPNAVLKRLQIAEAKIAKLEGLFEQVQRLEDAVTKP